LIAEFCTNAFTKKEKEYLNREEKKKKVFTTTPLSLDKKKKYSPKKIERAMQYTEQRAPPIPCSFL